jgi:hypothetical protein
MNHKTESNAYLYCSIGFSGKTVVEMIGIEPTIATLRTLRCERSALPTEL